MRTVNEKHHDRWFKTVVALSLVLALIGFMVPSRQMPLDYRYMLWCSLPIALVWVLVVGWAGSRFRKLALWLLIGAPLALYWPIWLWLNGIPGCFWSGTCI